MPISKKDAPDTLPSDAKDIYVSAFNSAYEDTCKDKEDRDECASKIAWSAVKNKYKKSGDTWEKKSEAIKELSLYISKASFSKKDQEMRGSAVASDTAEDQYGDKMSMALFNDFISRIEKDETAPEMFRSDFWSGGMPYLSVAHYSDQNGKGVPGDIESIYIDGNRLKQKFILNDNKIGRAIFNAILDDLYSEEPEFEDPVRISIAFIDWGHKHLDGGYVFDRKSLADKCPECLKGNEGKEYLKGQLIHCAFTRVPVNPRTEIESIEERSMAIKTKKDDAASIIGEDIAEELEQNELVGKSETLVVKSEEEEVVEEPESEDVAEEEKSKVEEEEEESAEDTEKEEEEKSMVGPTSISEMKEQIETEKELSEIGDLFSMFNEVMYNIFTSEHEDKKSLIKNATQEFQSMLEAKSMLAKEEQKSELEESWDSFLGAYNELPADVSGEEKLRLLQPSFEALGEAVQQSVVGKEVEEEVELEEGENLTLETLVKALQKANQPLYEQISLVANSLSEMSEKGKKSSTPARRSISPSLVQQSQSMPSQDKPKKKLSSLSAVINKSVGLPEDYQRSGALVKEE